MKAVELFCGMGMSAIGLRGGGATVVGACDIDKRFVKAFNSQTILPPVAKAISVDEYEPPEFDLLSGGPVCKAFSPGATLFGTEGQQDDRNTFPHFFRFLEKCSPMPEYVLVENSYGLKRFGGYVTELIERLNRMGYTVDYGEIDCFDYGVPQHRRRVIFLCSKKGDWKISKPLVRMGPSIVNECFLKPTPNSEPLLRPLSDGMRAYVYRDERHLKKHPPLELNKAASTVVANYKRGVPYGLVNNPSFGLMLCEPRLAARLQGLPDTYDLSCLSRTAALECIGNGFPTPVVRYMVGGLMA